MKVTCVILDRDGVINFDSPDYIKSPEEWVPIPGSLEAIALLNKNKILVAMATNQAGPAQGKFSKEMSEAIFKKLSLVLAEKGGHFDHMALCEHHPKALCPCRKPKIGMLLEIFEKLRVQPQECVFIGDSEKDIQAAKNAGVSPILVLTGNGEKTKTLLASSGELNGVKVFSDLLLAVEWLLSFSA